MIDYYLRATDETAMNVALQAAGITDSEGNAHPGMDLSIIGTIVRNEVALAGWHANLRTTVDMLDEQIAKLPIIDQPNNPVRVWFDHA